MARRDRTTDKRSEGELRRLVEEALRDEFDLGPRGLRLAVGLLEVRGRPPERIRVRATLHFLASGSPFCCGEPGCHCHLGTPFDPEIMHRVSDQVRRAMGLSQDVAVELADVRTNYHAGVRFHVLKNGSWTHF